jgi:hypothetical protein
MNNEVTENPSSSGEAREEGVVRSPNQKSEKSSYEWSASEMAEAQPYPMPIVPEKENLEEEEESSEEGGEDSSQK